MVLHRRELLPHAYLISPVLLEISIPLEEKTDKERQPKASDLNRSSKNYLARGACSLSLDKSLLAQPYLSMNKLQ